VDVKEFIQSWEEVMLVCVSFTSYFFVAAVIGGGRGRVRGMLKLVIKELTATHV